MAGGTHRGELLDGLGLDRLGFAPAPDPEHDTTPPVWTRPLPGGVSVFFRPDPDTSPRAFMVYLAAPRFARVMALWDIDDTGPLSALPRRKLRNDTRMGCLAMGLLAFDDGDTPGPDAPLMNGGIALSLRDLARLLDGIDGPAALNDALMRGRLGDWLTVVEQAWVFLFLCAERGLDADQISGLARQWMQADTALSRWRRTPAITPALARAYLDRHAAALPG